MRVCVREHAWLVGAAGGRLLPVLQVDGCCTPAHVLLCLVGAALTALPPPTLTPPTHTHPMRCRLLGLDSKSPSPVVARLHGAREAGRLSPRDERLQLK